MAVVVIFGLVVATFLTLVVVPTLYYLLERGKGSLLVDKEWLDGKRWGLYSLLSGDKGDMV